MLIGKEDLIKFPLANELSERVVPKRKQTKEFVKCRNKIIIKNYKFIRFYCRNNKYKKDELLSSGVIGFIKALERFDADKETELSTYCWYWVKQQVSKEIKDNYNYPLNFTFKDRLKIKDFLSKRELYKVKLIEEMDENDHHRYSYDVHEEVEKNELINKLHKAISFLPKNEQIVINKRLNCKTLQEIGDSMDLTRQRIKQIECKAMNKLKFLLKELND